VGWPIGLDVLREFEGIAFLKVADGFGGHHFALEIGRGDFDAELAPYNPWALTSPRPNTGGVIGGPFYVHDPEGNILELVCYDEAVG
jgi:catechol 2,3-dioxygenase-like lactoylglutathione lyase family enzyme